MDRRENASINKQGNNSCGRGACSVKQISKARKVANRRKRN